MSTSSIEIGTLLDHDRKPTTVPAMLDVDRLVQSRMLIQANSGGGKSHAIRLLLEASGGMLPFTLFDREGEFHTLREMHDLLIVGGDVPITLASARVTARATMHSGVSVIVNLSELPTAERGEYVRGWIEEMLVIGRATPKPRLVVIDEAHDFAPEAGDCESINAVRDLMATGRKRLLCGVLATQRLSKLSKDAAAECNNLMIGRCTLDTDQTRAAAALGFTKKDAIRLRDLRSGMFFAFGPAFFHALVEPIMTHKVKTTHGERAMQLQAPAPSEGIAAAIAVLAQAADAAAKDSAKADGKDGASNPAAAGGTEIAKLRADLEEAQVRCEEHDRDHALAIEAAKTHLSGVVTILHHCIERVTKAWNAIADPWDQASVTAGTLPASFTALPSHPDGVQPGLVTPEASPEPTRTSPVARRASSAGQAPHASDRPPAPAPAAHSLPNGLGTPHKRIIDALGWWRAAGVHKPSRAQVAVVAGYAATGGTFARYLSALSSAGLIEYPSAGEVSLKPAWWSLAASPKHPTPKDLHAAALDVLESPHRKILQVLLEAKGREVARTQVAELAGYEASGGTFNRYVSALSSAGMIRYPKRTTIAAATWLFPETLGGGR